MKGGPVALAFVARRSGTGKTTLMESVTRHLRERGWEVGAVKHSGHHVQLDREGTDSWRLSQAGSTVTVIAAPGLLATLRNVPEPSLDEAIQQCRGTRIVLIEGYKDLPLPKIEVYRSGYSEGLLCRGQGRHDPGLIAVASDVPLEVDVPVLPLNDPEMVCDFIIRRFFPGTGNKP